ncbi:MAG: hypothetical protein ABI080_21475 [Candidatus Binatia bacterium]
MNVASSPSPVTLNIQGQLSANRIHPEKSSVDDSRPDLLVAARPSFQ